MVNHRDVTERVLTGSVRFRGSTRKLDNRCSAGMQLESVETWC
jgi:hypothetical protein